MLALLEASVEEKKRQVRNIPPAFIYEMLDGKPIYYKGTHEAIRQKLSPESVAGTVRRQAYLLDLINSLFHHSLDKKQYRSASGGVGIQLERQSFVASDIVIYRADDRDKMFLDEFFDFPPTVAIQMGTKAELADFDDPMNYFMDKTNRLLNFGVEKVLWIFTKSQKIWLAQPGKNWETMGWEQTVEVLPGCNLNLLKLLEEDDTTLEEFMGIPESKP